MRAEKTMINENLSLMPRTVTYETLCGVQGLPDMLPNVARVGNEQFWKEKKIWVTVLVKLNFTSFLFRNCMLGWAYS